MMALAPLKLQNMPDRLRRSDESAASGLDNEGADKISRDAEFGVAHQGGVFLEVTQVFIPLSL